MKLSRCFAQTALALSIASLVAGCGGGNDQTAGGQTAFNIQPTSITLTGTTTACSGGYAGRVFVFGGAGPYQVKNTAPDIVALSRTRLERPGDYFDVEMALGACMTNISVVVVDSLGRQVTLSLNSQTSSS